MHFDEQELYFLACGAAILFLIGIIMSLLSRSNKGDGDDLVERLEKALPGAQCAQCGHPGCRAYAEALAAGTAPCNKCTPGGQDTTNQLSEILGVSVPESENEDEIFAPRTVAIIHESICTGCTKCTRVCPVDCISGRKREAHRVTERECIGCHECTKVCPVKCIEMVRLDPTIANFNWELNAIRFKGNNN